MNEENVEKTTEKQLGGITGKGFMPGESGNPAGRPKGRKNFDTIFEEAIRKIVEEKKIPIDNPEMEMVIKAVIEALKGNLGYYRDIMDRRYGKAIQPLEHSGNLTISQVLDELEKDDGQKTGGQELEDKQPLQNTK